jgi:hypothetical protein
MTSMQCKSVVRAAHYRQGAARLAIVAAAILLSACGVISNRKPIAPGTPVAHVHFGPSAVASVWFPLQCAMARPVTLINSRKAP